MNNGIWQQNHDQCWMHMNISFRHAKSKVWPSVGKSSAIVCWTRGFHWHNTPSMEIHTLLRWLSRCRVTNYINHPPEICEDVFVMMQLLATMATANSFYSNALLQTQFHVLLLCRGEICLEQFLQLRLNKNHVQFLPPAALETTHTCSRRSRQSIHFLFRDLNNIENNK